MKGQSWGYSHSNNNGQLYKAVQLKKNVIEVTADGEVSCGDDSLLVEVSLQYNPTMGRLVAHVSDAVKPYVTIRLVA